MTPNEELIMLKTFLDLIKPSYSTYIIAGEVNFEDNAAARDIGFQGSEYQFVPRDHANGFIHHDGWHYPNLDSGERTFDNDPNCLRLTKVYPEFILKDVLHSPEMFDETGGRLLDENDTLDNHGTRDNLDLTNT